MIYKYLFFGPYWLFCVVRASMSASFGEMQYGAFGDFNGLLIGTLGAAIWLGVVLIITAIIFSDSKNEKKGD